jgi:hypothetical protein
MPVYAPLDIFRCGSYGTEPVWVESCPDLATAKARIKMFMVSKPAEYFVLTTKTGHKQFFRPDDDSSPSQGQHR